MLPSSSSSHSTTHSNCNSRLFMGFSPCIRGFPLFSPANQPATANLFSVNRPSWAKNGRFSVGFHLQRSAISKPRTEEYKDVFQNGLSVIKWREIMDDDLEEDILKEVSTSNQIEERVESIRGMLGRMDDGEISVSAYDTAWVAMVQDVNGSGAPQFPTSLRWIADNQLPDGSWGDYYIFSAHDRIINTLACVIALKSWNTHPEKIEKGVLFIKENMKKLSEESDEHMPIGFEVAFPSLIEIARNLNIEIPDDSPVFQRIYAMRDLKLKRIPKDIMHLVPTTLLHSLEGMPNLEWEKLLKLQSTDGSFLFSPSSTAFALIQTQDDHCLAYLSKAVQKFNGGVPNVYPVDLFEHIWVVDRLERLGISRYFRSEIKECVDYVSRYWTREGICWARNSRVRDIDDTAMGFRLLRLHGYDASADVFEHFESDGEFFCFAGQSTQAVTGMFNLYRASQVAFPGEKILEDAKNFSSKFLREKQACNKLLDKWIITKDLPGEVGYALEVPWYASLPRVETRFYLEQYGGDDDVWIGKTLYRMPYVNNNTYLELAKLDFNDCQALHQLEWKSIQKWYEECGLGEFGMGKRGLLSAYYLAAASVFEPERSKERLAWAKTVTLVQTIGSHFQKNSTSYVDRKAFVHEFRNITNGLHYLNGRRYKTTQQSLSRTLLATLNQLSLDALVAHGRDIHRHLRRAWDTWMMTWQEGGDVYQVEAELLVRTLDLCAGRWESEEILSDPQYRRLSEITNRVCRHLRLFQRQRQEIKKKPCGMMREEIEGSMQEMVQVVVSQSSSDNTNGGLPSDIKQTFLTVARSFYYSAHCDPGTINSHIVKVLFERVL